MPLTWPDGQPFATGATAYQYRPATAQERTPRITLEVAIDGVVTHAMVDTGGIYLVCHPRLATQLRLEPAEAISGPQALLFRWAVVQGRLYRYRVPEAPTVLWTPLSSSLMRLTLPHTTVGEFCLNNVKISLTH